LRDRKFGIEFDLLIYIIALVYFTPFIRPFCRWKKNESREEISFFYFKIV